MNWWVEGMIMMWWVRKSLTPEALSYSGEDGGVG
jgi:hypothetical protein